MTDKPKRKLRVRGITKRGINLIKNFEGWVPTTYRDAAGYKTIAWGHLIRPWEDFSKIEPIDKELGEQLLRRDVLNAEAGVCRLIKSPLQDGEYEALVSFTFNLGSGALQRSTLRMKLNRGEYQEAGEEFLRWIYAGGRKLRGLIRRRKAERDLFLYGGNIEEEGKEWIDYA